MKQAYRNKKTNKIATCVEFKDGFAHFNIDGIRDFMSEKKFLECYEVYSDFRGLS